MLMMPMLMTTVNCGDELVEGVAIFVRPVCYQADAGHCVLTSAWLAAGSCRTPSSGSPCLASASGSTTPKGTVPAAPAGTATPGCSACWTCARVHLRMVVGTQPQWGHAKTSGAQQEPREGSRSERTQPREQSRPCTRLFHMSPVPMPLCLVGYLGTS